MLISMIPVTAVEENNVDEVQSFIDGILAYKYQESGISGNQEWLNGSLTQNAGVSSEWYVFALAQYGKYDFSSYENALLKYLSENEVASASSRIKYALVLISVGSTNEYIINTLNNSIGKQGIMSWVYGLHILNNGYFSEEHTVESVVDKLISIQLSDGGWALTGTNADVDITSMVIQALAPYYSADYEVKNAVDDALLLLSSRQKADGDFASYGVNNPESTAQVLVALSSLGIDCSTDERFIKNGNTLFDAIAIYRTDDGGYSHTLGGKINGNATVQVFYSLIAYRRMQQGKNALYILDNRTPDVFTKPAEPPEESSEPFEDESSEVVSVDESLPLEEYESTVESETTDKVDFESTVEASDTESKTLSNVSNESRIGSENETNTENNDTSVKSYKTYVCFAVITVAGIILIALYISKKRNIKNYILIIFVAVLLIVLVFLTDFKTPEDYYNQGEASKNDAYGTVTIKIVCTAISDRNNAHIPQNGIILDTVEWPIEDGDTVYDIISEVTAKHKIHLETNGSKETIYVEGIANIYEFDYGDLSGWIYRVNGEKPSVSCGDYVLKSGDSIEWHYSLALGEDIE